ncbi:MAG: hypothetical protein GY748_23940 [Planctomycetaceae bacterium]|nr:hypothetical protein [Planctomycetaceae bacterium]
MCESNPNIYISQRISLSALPKQLRFTGIVPVAALFFVLTSCATFPEQKKITQFGTAAVLVSNVVVEAYLAHLIAAESAAREREAAKYVLGTRDFKFPAKSNKEIMARLKKTWDHRIATVKAIGAYAKALSKISEPGAAKETAASSSTLIASIIKLADVTPGGTKALADALPNLARTAINASINNLFARSIQATIIKTDPYIQQITPLLSADISTLGNIPERNVKSLATNRKLTLNNILAGNLVSRDQRYVRYHLMSALQIADEARLAIFARAPSDLEKFAAAHANLLKSTDSDGKFKDFVSTANELASTFGGLINQ